MAWKVLLLVALLLLIFGKGKFSDLMGDLAKGIKSFRKGMAEDDGDERVTLKPAPAIGASAQAPAPDASKENA
ncbi:MAG: twin-arginine translocase TatA/TatE family subunit [Sphingomonadales bacterium]